MARGVARLNDRTTGTCFAHDPPLGVGGKIITASGDTKANGRGVARLNDIVRADCGHQSKIISASGTQKTNNRPTARLNDSVGKGPYVAKIITASGDTNVN